MPHRQNPPPLVAGPAAGLRPRRVLAGGLLLLAIGMPVPSLAEDAPVGAGLALQMGCYNCHRTPPHGDAPTFAHLAAEYAKYRGKADEAARLGEKLREGEPFHPRIVAHEQVSPETATKLMQWLIDGAKRAE